MFSVLAGRRLASGPPAEAGPASIPRARLASPRLGPAQRRALAPAAASPAQAHAALSRPPRRTRLHRLPGRHAAPVHRRRGAVPAPTSRASPSKRFERAHATPLRHSTSPASLPLALQQQQPRPSCRARRRAPPTSSSRTTAPFHDSRRPQFCLIDLHRLRSPEAAVVEVRAKPGASFLSREHAAVAAWTPTSSGQHRCASWCGSAR